MVHANVTENISLLNHTFICIGESIVITPELQGNIKGGHLQFNTTPPQLHNIADNQFDYGIENFRIWVLQFRNSQQSPASSATFFSSAQDGSENQPEIFLEPSVSMKTKNLP